MTQLRHAERWKRQPVTMTQSRHACARSHLPSTSRTSRKPNGAACNDSLQVTCTSRGSCQKKRPLRIFRDISRTAAQGVRSQRATTDQLGVLVSATRRLSRRTCQSWKISVPTVSIPAIGMSTRDQASQCETSMCSIPQELAADHHLTGGHNQAGGADVPNHIFRRNDEDSEPAIVLPLAEFEATARDERCLFLETPFCAEELPLETGSS